MPIVRHGGGGVPVRNRPHVPVGSPWARGRTTQCRHPHHDRCQLHPRQPFRPNGSTRIRRFTVTTSRSYAEFFVPEDEVVLAARGRAADLGCVPIGSGGAAALTFLAAA